jgi:hypothetical protein
MNQTQPVGFYQPNEGDVGGLKAAPEKSTIDENTDPLTA